MKNIFVTGPPRCGKSTLIERLIRQINKPTTGFFTRQIEERGRRTGFAIVTLDGKEGVLAHEKMKSRFRVGKYGVNMEDIDQIAVPSMVPADSGTVVVIDEVGKMECFSRRFKETLIEVLDSEHPVLGSIALKGDRFIKEIKAREDIFLVRIDHQNRDSRELHARLLSALDHE